MNKLHENYYQRKCYFEREQVPTQSVIRKKMSESLAKVFFKSMTPKLKVLVGLEPPLKGGGNDWHMPPADLLKGKAAMKPLKKEHLSRLCTDIIYEYGDKFVADHQRDLENEKREILEQSDTQWKTVIEDDIKEICKVTSEEAAKNNTQRIQTALREFEVLYVTSFTKIESLLFEAAYKEVERAKQETYMRMQNRYEKLLKAQATQLYDQYTEKLEKKKAELKENFKVKLEEARDELGKQLHDINVDKHVAVEKLRHLLECQNVACQVYVALKEQEAHQNEAEEIKEEHKRTVKLLTEQIARKDEEIEIALENEKAEKEYKELWQKKVCHVVKKFQMFVSYCLKNMPDYAEFFINMEKLMMIQLSEALVDPETESIFVPEKDVFPTPVARPKPFVLVGDFGYKPHLNEELCPARCSSSASQLPVVLVNKRCIYAACDNFKVFSDKVEKFINDRLENEIQDDHDYTCAVPVKFTESQKIEDLKLEGSLMQLIQKEIVRTRVAPIRCDICKLDFCSCHPPKHSESIEKTPKSSEQYIGSGIKLTPYEYEEKSKNEEEPKKISDKCKSCSTKIEKMFEYLPPYMKTTSKYNTQLLPNYETCSVETLNMLVKKARNRPSKVPEKQIKPQKQYQDIGIQVSEDTDYHELCNCFSEEEIQKLCEKYGRRLPKPEQTTAQREVLMTAGSPDVSYLDQSVTSFTTDRALSLRLLLHDAPILEEIFNRSNCHF